MWHCIVGTSFGSFVYATILVFFFFFCLKQQKLKAEKLCNDCATLLFDSFLGTYLFSLALCSTHDSGNFTYFYLGETAVLLFKTTA